MATAFSGLAPAPNSNCAMTAESCDLLAQVAPSARAAYGTRDARASQCPSPGKSVVHRFHRQGEEGNRGTREGTRDSEAATRNMGIVRSQADRGLRGGCCGRQEESAHTARHPRFLGRSCVSEAVAKRDPFRRTADFAVCRACSTTRGCKSPVHPDGGEGQANRKGVTARWGLKEAIAKARPDGQEPNTRQPHRGERAAVCEAHFHQAVRK